MKKIIIPMIIFFITACGITFSKEETPPNMLWQKAVKIAGQNKNLTPGLMITRTEELDDKGKVKSCEDTYTKMYEDEYGNVKSEIYKIIVDGKDVTAERKRQKENQQSKISRIKGKRDEMNSIVDYRGCNPFAEEVQPAVSMKPLEYEVINGTRCRVFEFNLNKGNGSFAGNAWLDADTGVPVQIKFKPVPMKSFVSKMVIVILYDYTSSGLWYPKKVNTEVSVGFMFINKNMRIKMDLSNYWTKKK